MKKYLNNKKFVLVSIVVVFVTSLAFVAIASFDNEVSACVNNKNGSVRVLNFLGGQCTKTETALVWNKQGPVGLQGEKGDKGDTGEPGLNGPIVVDATNQIIGFLTGTHGAVNGEYFDVFDTNLSAYAQYYSTTGMPVLTAHSVGRLGFSESDCSGKIYLENVSARYVLYTFRDKYYLPKKDVLTLDHPTFPSNLEGDGLCRNNEIKPNYAVEADPIDVQYTGPLNIE